ncbi:PIN-like domain-containing protein [Rhizobium sp. 12,4]|uniref:PIN-like domain-containing protein n=1 Tax=Rhizobium sp. 12,4 TaxID=3405135 RepID=UPI003D34CB01
MPSQPDTMKLHPPTVSHKTHFEKVAAALKADTTVVFCDTSVLFWLFGLGAEARAEFLKWVRDELQMRFRVPVWAAHELHKHMVESPGRLLPLHSEIKSVQAKIKELKRLVSLAADNRRRPGFLDRREYIASLDRSAEEFIKQCKAAGQTATWQDLATEIVPFINEHVLSSNIFPLHGAEAEYGTRASGRVPPGFKDKNKLENRFGDLVFWQEIVKHCSEKPAFTSAVLLTDDNKPDWVFRPETVLDDGGNPHRNISSDGYETFLAPPLLTHEIGTASKISEFFIVNTAMLAVTLERFANYQIPALFAAAQPVVPPSGSASTSVGGHEPERSEGANAEVAPAAELVEALGSTSAIEQERALDDLQQGINSYSSDELQNLGRGVSQATRTELQNASNMIYRLDLLAESLPSEERNALYFGMLKDLYFDPSGRPRPLPLDGDVEAIFHVLGKCDLSEALEKFGSEIRAYEERYLRLPSPNADKVRLSFMLGPERRNRPRELEQIVAGGRQIVEEIPIDSVDALTRVFPEGSATLDELLAAIAKRYSVPLDWLILDQPGQTLVNWDDTKGFVDL